VSTLRRSGRGGGTPAPPARSGPPRRAVASAPGSMCPAKGRPKGSHGRQWAAPAWMGGLGPRRPAPPASLCPARARRAKRRSHPRRTPPPLPRPCSKCKLYRFDSNSNEWKERGIGQVRLLRHKANERIRLLMRQEKTLKIRANHISEFESASGPPGARRASARPLAMRVANAQVAVGRCCAADGPALCSLATDGSSACVAAAAASMPRAAPL
jgi:hypothetical protein